MPSIASWLGFNTGGTRGLNVATPTPRNFNTETGQIFDTAATYAPRQNDLNLSGLNTTLNGDPNNQGWLSLFQNDIAPALTATQSSTARTLNPTGTALYDELGAQAANDLAAGGKLRPEDTNAITKSITSDYANRGFGRGLPAADLEKAMQLYAGGEAVKSNRRAFASSVVDQGKTLFGSPETINQEGLGVLGAAQPDNSKTLDQLLSYGSDVNNTNYNAQAAALIGTANNKAAVYASHNSY